MKQLMLDDKGEKVSSEEGFEMRIGQLLSLRPIITLH